MFGPPWLYIFRVICGYKTSSRCVTRRYPVMFLIIFLLLFGNSLATEFDNSILLTPPWDLEGSCAPLPDTCGQNLIDKPCVLCNGTGKCTVYVAVVLPLDDFFIVHLKRVKLPSKSTDSFVFN